MTWKTVLYEKRDRVALITLNRPDVLNALSPDLTEELTEALREAEADSGVGCLLVTGAGRAFSAGGDMAMFRQGLEGRAALPLDKLYGLVDTLFHLKKPTVAAINGPAIGGGATVSLHFDIRIASEQARFAFMFPRVGLVPELGSTFLLPHIVGFARAVELVLTCRTVDAQEALALGLVTRVVPAEALMEEAMSLARELAHGPTRTLARAKEVLQRGVQGDLQTAFRFEQEVLGYCLSSPEHREGIAAFLERRQPRWVEISEGQAG